ncbi:MAG TPA: PDZ domain-containing protein, partial [Agriterribacter sp.]|nr:PDZ domain-containing protein [Agriterribacter sp.]
MQKVTCSLALILFAASAFSQIDASLFRYPHLSQTRIVFVYGGDIWVAPKTGGVASKLTSSAGEESYPRFSPDGRTIAYSAGYDGNVDIYTIPADGGIPARITYHSMPDRVVDWYPDGSKILFASPRESGSGRYNQFFAVAKNGGLPQKLSIPYGELGSLSPDGERIAYVTRITENYPFKRYRGGYASDVLLYDLKQNTVENITRNPATDGKPAWVKNKIFYVSDAGKNQRRNIWVYEIDKKSNEQLTHFEQDDINYMSAGPAELVFEAGGKLYLLNTTSFQYKEVRIDVISDRAAIMPRTVNVSNYTGSFDVSPDGKRAVIEARGELFSVPAEQGYVLNLTATSGTFEREPSWSPNGKYIAYWSDESGENEMYIREIRSGAAPRKLTAMGKGFGWHLYWSPDSKKIAFIDFQQSIKVITIANGAVTTIDHTKLLTYSSFGSFSLSWSPDSKWLAYSKGLENLNDAIFLYSFAADKVIQATSGYYNDTRPVFDPGGRYLYFLTDRNFSPAYSSMDGSWIYANSTQLAVATLDPSGKRVLFPENDEVKVTADTASDKTVPKEKKKKETGPPAVPVADVKVSAENLEARIEVLPVAPGNFGGIAAVEGKLLYQRYPNTGAAGGKSSLHYYDIEKREEKTILDNVTAFVVSKNGKAVLVRDEQGFGIVQAAAAQKIEKRLPVGEMAIVLDPREEWNQIFNDTWRRYRDFFYDPNMHKVDWMAMKKHYGAMISDASTRWDVNNILLQLISELSAGHTYAGGGDAEKITFRETGFLGIDWQLEQGRYKIKKIIRPAVWDNEVRSPLDHPGMEVQEGDYILSVNGRVPDPAVDPYAVFEGLAGKTVTLKISHAPSSGNAKDITVKLLSQQEEARLRNLEWIEGNRKKVEQLSNGQLGYMYMPNTGTEGQTELLRQFYAQVN